jgi:hypothetical protein
MMGKGRDGWGKREGENGKGRTLKLGKFGTAHMKENLMMECH